LEKEKFKKKFPNLSKEIEKGMGKVDLEFNRNIRRQPRRFSGYSPNVVDFLLRCKNNDEAFEIIDFLMERGEITPTRAKELRIQIEKQGLRSFGKKKEIGYYENEG
jgi:hypothetical protein